MTQDEGFREIEKNDARIAAHKAFDAIWSRQKNRRDRRLARLLCYKWLAKRLGIPEEDCHMSMFDVKTCERVISICEDVTMADVVPGWRDAVD